MQMMIPNKQDDSTHVENEAIRGLLIAEAERRMAEYPQYRGHWKDYQLVVVAKDLEFKGCTIHAGTVTLAKMESAPIRAIRTPGVVVVAFETNFSKMVANDCVTTEVDAICWLT